MLIRKLDGLPGSTAGDASFLRELLHPDRSALNIRYSLAHAVVRPGRRTAPHRLRSSEVYYILEGRGLMRIDGEEAEVRKSDAVYIPPGSLQHIENIGPDDLTFLCIVDPAWKTEDEEVLKED